MKQITFRDLMHLGYEFDRPMLIVVEEANEMYANGHDVDLHVLVREVYSRPENAPVQNMRREHLPFHVNLDASDDPELALNRKDVIDTMTSLMKIPTIEKGAIMPDACPAGVICVGGVVAAKDAIHPAFHSADICCSMSLTEFAYNDSKTVLDAGMSVTHFGPTGRTDFEDMPEYLFNRIMSNKLTRPLMQSAKRDFATQGDGNHFLFVGKSKKSGNVCVVTHHGSRSFGAKLYKKGMKIAEDFAKRLAPKGMNRQYAWIPFNTPEGRMYWDALQIIRLWTMENHNRIHDMIRDDLGLEVVDHFWNEHNFVFKRDDLFYHAKGATPGWSDYERTLVPLNMAEPVLVTRGTDSRNGIGFLPHGAGRNMGRAAFKDKFPNPELPSGIDVRSYSGKLDVTELPQAYKDASEVKAQIERYNLAEVIDEIIPYGSIMAGEQENHVSWAELKRSKKRKLKGLD